MAVNIITDYSYGEKRFIFRMFKFLATLNV